MVNTLRPNKETDIVNMRTALAMAGLLLACITSVNGQPPSAPFKLAFVSNREHYWYPHVYLYEHDGKSNGKIIGSIDPQDKRLDHQPVLSADGKTCVFGLEMEGQVGQLRMWDIAANKARELQDLFRTPNAVFSPSLSGDGKLLALSAWNRPGSSARWDVLLFDLAQRQAIDLPSLNTSKYDERRAAISSDGDWLAYTSNAPDGCGLTDIRLYSRPSKHMLPLLEMNSSAADSFPSVSGDGRLICFASDRPNGQGGFDIYLYDRGDGAFIPLPGLNSPGHEQTPFLSREGRWIAFVSERLGSAGEHDIFVYDRSQKRLLETPGLNTDRDDYDPCLISTASGSPN
jgi:Tol biopolymer transport system component